jgi:transposase-like protein
MYLFYSHGLIHHLIRYYLATCLKYNNIMTREKYSLVTRVDVSSIKKRFNIEVSTSTCSAWMESSTAHHLI